MSHIELSVVMATYDDVLTLSEAIESVLNQTFSDFEFIIINDGSSDPHTEKLLAHYANLDSRVRILEKENEGLTKALIDGCRAACGEFIARQDADDVSVPERFEHQIECLLNHPDALLCVAGTQFETFDEDVIDQIIPETNMEILSSGMLNNNVGVPSHGCVMFRKSAYVAAGGYRWPFYYAQDCDLWLRMIEVGPFCAVDEILYRMRESLVSISSQKRGIQQRFAELSVKCAELRRHGVEESYWLEQVKALREDALKVGSFKGRKADRTTSLLIASRMMRFNKSKARSLLYALLLRNPLDLRVAKALLKSYVL